MTKPSRSLSKGRLAFSGSSFRFADRVVNGNTGRTASVSVSNATGAPATATVTDPRGRVITTADVGESTTLKIPIKGLKRTTTYAVTISDGAGLSDRKSVV